MKLHRIFLTAAVGLLMACGSNDQKVADSEARPDSVETESQQTDSDTSINATGSMSGSNGTGTDTTDMHRQKATRQKAQ